MRIRNVKPEFYRSDDIDALTWEHRFVFIALFTYVDDNGVGRDRESDICADLFAGDFSIDPGGTLGRVRHALLALVERGLVVRYTVEGKRFLFITGWDDHQYVKNPNRERYPRPDKALLTSSVHPGETQSKESVDVTPALPPVVGSKSLVVGSSSIVHPTTPSRFDEFWSVYPKRGKHSNPKAPAQAKWDKLTKTINPQVIIDSAKVLAKMREGQDPQHTPQAVTWLNQRRFEDEYEPVEDDSQPRYDSLGFLL